MAGPVLSEYTILVPDSTNSGVPIDRSVLEEYLLEQFGGFTRKGGLQGAWKDSDGTVYRDAITAYTIAVEGPHGYEQIVSAAAIIGATLSQRAVYVGLPNGQSQILSL